MSLTEFHNRPARRIESDEVRVTVMQCGGHVAETTYRPTGINPLWIQDRPTIDADQYDPLIHGPIYGDDGEGRLIPGLLGHNLCIPYWGLPSEAEYRRGMTCHGEPNAMRWQERLRTLDQLSLRVTLPESGLRVDRYLKCTGPIVHFETAVENLLSLDRPIAWCEHVTIDPPFLSSRDTGFWANLGRGYRTTSSFNDVFFGRRDVDRFLATLLVLPASRTPILSTPSWLNQTRITVYSPLGTPGLVPSSGTFFLLMNFAG